MCICRISVLTQQIDEFVELTIESGDSDVTVLKLTGGTVASSTSDCTRNIKVVCANVSQFCSSRSGVSLLQFGMILLCSPRWPDALKDRQVVPQFL